MYNTKEVNRFSSCVFTFKDIEDTMRTCSGTEDCNIERWIENLKEIISLTGLSKLHKFIFTKKCLKSKVVNSI